MQVRTNGIMGDRLFDWEPETNTVVIVKKKMVYRVKLFDEYSGQRYKIVDRYPRDLKNWYIELWKPKELMDLIRWFLSAFILFILVKAIIIIKIAKFILICFLRVNFYLSKVMNTNLYSTITNVNKKFYSEYNII